jgi:antitoxin YefM
MTKTMSATEARKNFFKVMEMAQRPGLPVKITHEGRPAVIMMSEEEFEGWMETLDIMSNPEEVAAIKEASQEKTKGKVVSFEEVKKKLRL